LTIHTSVEICRHLDRLAKTGFFGRSRSSVAEHLLSEKLLQVLREARGAGLFGKPQRGGQEGF